jgi:DNA-directed RNA polymerase I, II, and III subunit RPABC5
MCILPIRCYTCGKTIANKWESYQNMLSEEVSTKDALDRLGLKKICCRRMILGHVDLINNLLKYSHPIESSSSSECYVLKE